MEAVSGCDVNAWWDTSHVLRVQPIDRCGYMTKQGQVVKNWKKRWFVLAGNTLSYYKSREDKTPAGVIELQGCRAVKVCMENVGRANTLEVEVPGRTFLLSCDEDDEMNEWLGAISRAVIRSNARGEDWEEVNIEES